MTPSSVRNAPTAAGRSVWRTSASHRIVTEVGWPRDRPRCAAPDTPSTDAPVATGPAGSDALAGPRAVRGARHRGRTGGVGARGCALHGPGGRRALPPGRHGRVEL